MRLVSQLTQRWRHYLVGLFLVLLTVVTVVGERGVFHLLRLKGEKRKLDEQNYRLQKENESLRRRIQRLRNDNFYLEKLAREELNLVRPGEVIYRFRSTEPEKDRTGLFSAENFAPRPSTGQKARP